MISNYARFGLKPLNLAVSVTTSREAASYALYRVVIENTYVRKSKA